MVARALDRPAVLAHVRVELQPRVLETEGVSAGSSSTSNSTSNTTSSSSNKSIILTDCTLSPVPGCSTVSVCGSMATYTADSATPLCASATVLFSVLRERC